MRTTLEASPICPPPKASPDSFSMTRRDFTLCARPVVGVGLFGKLVTGASPGVSFQDWVLQKFWSGCGKARPTVVDRANPLLLVNSSADAEAYECLEFAVYLGNSLSNGLLWVLSKWLVYENSALEVTYEATFDNLWQSRFWLAFVT